MLDTKKLGKGLLVPLPDGRAVTEADKKLITEINAAMMEQGYFFYMGPWEGGKEVLLIAQYKEEYRPRNIRGAGRKQKELGDLTCGAVRSMLQVQSAKEISQVLGVSRSTLFRRLKNKADTDLF